MQPQAELGRPCLTRATNNLPYSLLAEQERMDILKTFGIITLTSAAILIAYWFVPWAYHLLQDEQTSSHLSQNYIDDRNKYLKEAQSLDFLNAVFCIYFYNSDVKRWGPPPKPDDISPNEVFQSFAQEDFDAAIEKSKKLIREGLHLGNLAYDRSEEGILRFQKEKEIYKKNNFYFNQKNLDRAFSSGMRDMR